MDVVSCERDVGREILDFLRNTAYSEFACRSSLRSQRTEKTHHDVGTSGLRLVLEVQSDQMPRQHPIALVINLVEHEVQEIEPRDQSRRQVNVARDGPVQVVL